MSPFIPSGFDLSVEHPHTYVVKCAQMVKGVQIWFLSVHNNPEDLCAKVFPLFHNVKVCMAKLLHFFPTKC